MPSGGAAQVEKPSGRPLSRGRQEQVGIFLSRLGIALRAELAIMRHKGRTSSFRAATAVRWLRVTTATTAVTGGSAYGMPSVRRTTRLPGKGVHASECSGKRLVCNAQGTSFQTDGMRAIAQGRVARRRIESGRPSPEYSDAKLASNAAHTWDTSSYADTSVFVGRHSYARVRGTPFRHACYVYASCFQPNWRRCVTKAASVPQRRSIHGIRTTSLVS